MPTLIDAVLARDVLLGPQGIKGMVDRINDREEFVCPVPSEFPVKLGFIFTAMPDSIFAISTEVRSHMGAPLWFDSGKLATPSDGRGEFALEIPIPVRDVGPCIVSLSFDGTEVWRQRVFFALA
jgi:hypothetical protein